MKKLIEEFKAFALKGNMVDLAIGLIIGAAFSKVVNSLVADILMPPIGMLLGGVDFSDLAFSFQMPGISKPPVEIRYGAFINTIIDFLIIALSVFAVIKGMNKLHIAKKAEAPPAPTTKKCPECLLKIPLEAKKCGHCCSELKSLQSH